MASRRLRVHVSLRPKQRDRRNQIAGAGAVVLLLGTAALATLRHAASSLPRTLFRVEVDSPSEALRREATDFLSTRAGQSPSAQAAALLKRFSCLKAIAVRRHWFGRVARLELSPRVAVARATPDGYLSDDGVVFSAPAGLYDLPGPAVNATGASPEQLRSAAKLCAAAARPGAVAAPLDSLRLISAQDGWEARLADATIVLFGDGRWASEKFARLSEALADARSQPEAPTHFAADLRYFEDGKVLLRPLTR